MAATLKCDTITNPSNTGTGNLSLDSSGNVGIGVTPSAWTIGKAIQIAQSASFTGQDGVNSAYMNANAYYGSSAWTYINSDLATSYRQYNGTHAWFTAASGTAGNAITFTQAMTLFGSGGLSIGNTTDPGATNLSVSGTISDGTDIIRPLVLKTAANTTSGSAFNFSSIPSWVTRITVIFNETSLSGSDDFLVQIGTGGTPATSGYVSSGGRYSSAGTAVTGSTTGFNISPGGGGVLASGHMIIINISGDTWISSHSVKNTTGSVMCGGGSVSLSGTLDYLRITRSGTNTFDSGSVNILYE